ncbi:fibril protein [Spiroplasma sp. TIUS-1]|uniref:cytoskeletal motor fibril protein Fib n=1 Tax=Spiroplasma sp. TIUS-1 TaxID=216963 RepID=UPI0013977FCD|nr:cytoskeletal motor fibril protein Fib [Spiroplasma sp. TIUS-1]QHX35888.1 fibril protein [Spiroplasma sp. TIUS-1]
MIGIISTTYFELNEKVFDGFKLEKKYWWKNVVIQQASYKGIKYLLITTGVGKANAAMALTYITEKFPKLMLLLNVDIALSTNENFKTGDVVFGSNFIYRDSDLTVFEDVKYGQMLDEPENYTFTHDFITKIKNFKLGMNEGVIGTADTLIYNSDQFKDMISKFGFSIDVIDTEAGVLAQIARKSSIDFMALKVIYSNAMLSWENDPLHNIRIIEATNKMKYVIIKLINLLVLDVDIDFNDLNEMELEVVNDLFYFYDVAWIKKFHKNAHYFISGMGPSLFITDAKRLNPIAVDFVLMDWSRENNVIAESKSEMYSTSKFWENKKRYLDSMEISPSNILLNKSTRSNPHKKRLSIEDYCKYIAKQIAIKCENKDYYSFNGVIISDKSLVVSLLTQPSFYLTNIKNHELLQDFKIAKALLKNEFIKYLNFYLEKVKSPFKKIVIFIKVVLDNGLTLDIDIETQNQINTTIKINSLQKVDKSFVLVDILRDDYDQQKVGSIKINIDINKA